ncbi:DUF2306 domain-containing protein [Actinomycetospora aeridis]|uniref:DUF2306 domain-containing protein n=1 Tax=Actinomycetospora aeridis TaxID=3129231 RepID=A0ABU8NAU3_9PSEU
MALEPWTLLIGTHAVAAVLALVLGAVNTLRRVRGDRPHRRIGRAWLVSMLLVSATSFWIGDYDDAEGLFLHGLAVATIVSIVIGWWAARQGQYITHGWCMVCPYVGLLGALVGVVATPVRMIPSWFRAYPLPMTLIAAGLVVAAAVGARVALRRRTPVPARPEPVTT